MSLKTKEIFTETMYVLTSLRQAMSCTHAEVLKAAKAIHASQKLNFFAEYLHIS